MPKEKPLVMEAVVELDDGPLACELRAPQAMAIMYALLQKSLK
jgi:hypothetical protein